MDIQKALTAALVEDLQALIPAGRVCRPGFPATALGRQQSPDKKGGHEHLHGEVLCVTNRRITGPRERALGVLPLLS